MVYANNFVISVITLIIDIWYKGKIIIIKLYSLFSHLMSPSETESANAGVFKTCSSPNN